MIGRSRSWQALGRFDLQNMIHDIRNFAPAVLNCADVSLEQSRESQHDLAATAIVEFVGRILAASETTAQTP